MKLCGKCGVLRIAYPYYVSAKQHPLAHNPYCVLRIRIPYLHCGTPHISATALQPPPATPCYRQNTDLQKGAPAPERPESTRYDRCASSTLPYLDPITATRASAPPPHSTQSDAQLTEPPRPPTTHRAARRHDKSRKRNPARDPCLSTETLETL